MAETQSFKEAKETVKQLPSVNDWGIRLIKSFNEATKDEEQQQYLLQVVEIYRKNFEKYNCKDLQDM